MTGVQYRRFLIILTLTVSVDVPFSLPMVRDHLQAKRVILVLSSDIREEQLALHAWLPESLNQSQFRPVLSCPVSLI